MAAFCTQMLGRRLLMREPRFTTLGEAQSDRSHATNAATASESGSSMASSTSALFESCAQSVHESAV